MPIRFKCPHCQKTLGVKDHLAGRKASCPACKNPIVIPAPVAAPADLDDFAAKAFDDDPAKKAAEAAPENQTIKFTCEFCDAEVEFPPEEGGKKAPCPECRRILRIPLPKKESKDWRDVRTTGPSGALINQPKQLEGAWGSTTDKGHVSKEAMDEADAYIYEEEEVGLGVWIKRAFVAACIIGLLTAVTFSAMRSQSMKRQKDSIKQALEVVNAAQEKPRSWKAEIHRVAGELHVHRKQPDQARAQFNNAWAQFFRSEPSVDQDLFLLRLALTQLELGGSTEQTEIKEKLDWQDVRKDLEKTLQAIHAVEARVLALRRVGTQLFAKNQDHLAINLAGELSQAAPAKQKPLFTAQMVAFLIARKDSTAAEKLLKPPTKEIPDLATRMAYTEGWTRLGLHKEAVDFASSLGFPQDRMHACLGGAAVILGDPANTNAAVDAQPFLEKALLAFQSRGNQEISPWLTFQLVTLGTQTGLADKVQDIARFVPGDFKAHLELANLQAALAKSGSEESLRRLEDVTSTRGLARALALEMLARHNARFGDQKDLLLWAEQNATDPVRAFLFAGMALGELDRRK